MGSSLDLTLNLKGNAAEAAVFSEDKAVLLGAGRTALQLSSFYNDGALSNAFA